MPVSVKPAQTQSDQEVLVRKMGRMTLALSASLILLLPACAADEEPEEPDETPTEVEESPTPTPLGTFQLQGRILETLASVAGPRAEATPSPTASPTGSPTGSPSPEAEGTDAAAEGEEMGGDEEAESEATPTPTVSAITNGAPGALTVRLTSFTGEATACAFEEGDTVAVAYTRATSFTPADVTANERFPRNLRETNVSVQGRILEEGNCILVADAVGPQAPASPSPTATASPSPTATASPSPTATASPSPTVSP